MATAKQTEPTFRMVSQYAGKWTIYITDHEHLKGKEHVMGTITRWRGPRSVSYRGSFTIGSDDWAQRMIEAFWTWFVAHGPQ